MADEFECRIKREKIFILSLGKNAKTGFTHLELVKKYHDSIHKRKDIKQTDIDYLLVWMEELIHKLEQKK